MEAKLAVYQLAAPCTTCGGLGNADRRAQRQQERAARQQARAQRRTTEGNFLQRNNITVDSAINRVNDLIDLAGGVADIVNKFKNGQKINVGGRTLSPEEEQELLRVVNAKQQGNLDSYVESTLSNPNSNDTFLQDYIKMQALNKSDNTALYIGLGVGGVLLITQQTLTSGGILAASALTGAMAARVAASKLDTVIKKTPISQFTISDSRYCPHRRCQPQRNQRTNYARSWRRYCRYTALRST